MYTVDGDLYMPSRVSSQLDCLRDGMSRNHSDCAESVFLMMAKMIIIDSREAFAAEPTRA
jgi:hypothetical protein